MMVRVALSQSGRTPIFVNSFDELRQAAQASDVACVIVSTDDLTRGAVTPQSVTSGIRSDIRVVFLATGHAIMDIQAPAVRVVRIPFSAAELRLAIDSDERPQRHGGMDGTNSSPADITELVKAEIDRIVREKAETMLAEAVMKIVPELAEVMIKDELQRLLAQEAERAVCEDPPPEED